MQELLQLQAVVHAARRIGSDPEGNESCGSMAPCADVDDHCRCVRLAKLALGSTMNITEAYDGLPEGVQF